MGAGPTQGRWGYSVGFFLNHHQRRSNPHLYGVNVTCLDGVSPFDFAHVPVVDGGNHLTDTGQSTRIAGTLCFLPIT